MKVYYVRTTFLLPGPAAPGHWRAAEERGGRAGRGHREGRQEEEEVPGKDKLQGEEGKNWVGQEEKVHTSVQYIVLQQTSLMY